MSDFAPVSGHAAQRGYPAAVRRRIARRAALVEFGAALLMGSLHYGVGEIWAATVHERAGVVWYVVWGLRAPRAAAAFACGGLLALAGALLQVLLRNPLADPYVLGISSGASLGALAAIALGYGAVSMNMASLAGALAAICLLFVLSYRAGGWNMYRVLLTGVVLSAGLAALISLTLLIAPQAQVKGMLYWLMGDLSHAERPLGAWLVLLGVLAVSCYCRREARPARPGRREVALARCERRAAAGDRVLQRRRCNGRCGDAGRRDRFVGLMVPHAVRLLGVTRHRALLPLSVLLGGTFLTAADTAGAPALGAAAAAVGVLTALLGVPVMLVLIGRAR